MDDFGWLLFILGVLFLAVSVAIGMDTGNLRVANLSGIIAGIACTVGGAVFVIVGRIEKFALNKAFRLHLRSDSGG